MLLICYIPFSVFVTVIFVIMLVNLCMNLLFIQSYECIHENIFLLVYAEHVSLFVCGCENDVEIFFLKFPFKKVGVASSLSSYIL